MSAQPLVAVVDQGFGRTDDYVRAVARAGGRAEVLRWQDGRDGAADATSLAAGAFVLCGGDDLPGRHFGQADHPAATMDDPRRDAYELAFLRAWCATERPRPLLAVCRGMQLLSVVRGGDVDQHLPDVNGRAEHRGGVVHEIDVLPGSLLAQAADAARGSVNSHHHQAVAAPGDGVVVTARSADLCIEAVELPGRPFLGVQWHPEREGCDPGLGDGLFAWLTSAARRGDGRG